MAELTDEYRQLTRLLTEFQQVREGNRRNGDTLEAILELCKENLPPERPYLFEYPADGDYAAITAGWTEVDFIAGTVTTPAGAVTRISQKGLPAHSKGKLRSLIYDCTGESVLYLDSGDKFPVGANEGLVLNDIEFRKARIYVANTSDVFLAACTSPATFTGGGAGSSSNTMVYGSLLDADGTGNIFETDQAITDTATLYLTLVPAVSKFKLTTVRFYMNQTNAVTYELYLLENTAADNVTNLSYAVFDSDAAKADSTAYIYTGSNSAKLPTDVYLATAGRLYYMIDWSGAPGDTPGYIEVRGEAMT